MSPILYPWLCLRDGYHLGDVLAGPILMVGGREVLGKVKCPKCGKWRRFVKADHAPVDMPSAKA